MSPSSKGPWHSSLLSSERSAKVIFIGDYYIPLSQSCVRGAVRCTEGMNIVQRPRKGKGRRPLLLINSSLAIAPIIEKTVGKY